MHGQPRGTISRDGTIASRLVLGVWFQEFAEAWRWADRPLRHPSGGRTRSPFFQGSSKPSKAPARQHNQAWLITTWLWVSGFFCAVWCRRPTEEWIVNSLFPACLRSTPMCFLPSVSWQVQQLFCPSRVPHRSGDFQPQTGFWQSCGTDFWKEPSTSSWELLSNARWAARWITVKPR